MDERVMGEVGNGKGEGPVGEKIMNQFGVRGGAQVSSMR